MGNKIIHGMTEEEQFEQDYKDYVNRRRACLASRITPEVITYMEEEFQTDLPCYQTRSPATGEPVEPNPIKAAIRDGQREVILWLKHELKQHEKQQQKTNQ